MTPIQRISEKSQALDVLSLSRHATTADIRAAYKRLVHEKHPDHGRGTSDELAEITEAYRFLKDNAEELGIRDTRVISRSINPRPSVKPTETAFSDDIIAECQSALSEDSDRAQHISTMLHRMGRKLTYFVPTTPANGVSEVVVPTGELVDTRSAHPQIVPVQTNDIAAGVYDVPSDVCDVLFPGARSVKIKFVA